jgi:hypothetical protein
MTWFRRMEKEGVKINWVEKTVDVEQVVSEIKNHF